jgi:hypothetical protein
VSRTENGVIVLCGTPGLDLNACAKNLAESANTVRMRCLESPVCVEEFLPAAAANALALTLPDSIGEYSLIDVLGLPYDELVVAANDGLRRALEYTILQLDDSPADIALVTLHPVLLHQRTSEFVVPYFGSNFSALSDNDVRIRYYVGAEAETGRLG